MLHSHDVLYSYGKYKCLPSVIFGGLYIRPRDSSYYSPATLASITQKRESDDQCIIIGDLNSRCGTGVQRMVQNHPLLHYTPIDLMSNPNGNDLLQTCVDNDMLIVNNLRTNSKFFESALTFRWGKTWKTELDICIISNDLIDSVDSLSVNQSFQFPSDHAPVTVCFDFSQLSPSPARLLVEAERLFERATDLSADGDAVLCPSLCRAPVRARAVNQPTLTEELRDLTVPVLNPQDPYPALATFCDVVYNHSARCRKKPPEPNYSRPDRDANRWRHILHQNDSQTL